MSSRSKEARRRSRKPSMETTVERIVIMPTTVGRWRKNLQPFSALRSFEQAHHGRAGLQGPYDPAVAPARAAFRDIGFQQYPRLQQPSRRALSLPKQRLKLFALLAAQPHNVLLYRNVLRSHDRPHPSIAATTANHKVQTNSN